MTIFEKNNEHEQVGILLENFNLYYRNLSQKGKLKFVYRVLNLEKVLIFKGQGIVVSPEMKGILLSYIAQLTFGLNDYFLTGYEYINVYPDSFYLKNNDEFNDGVTYNNKIICISWKKFSEGHLLAADGENLFFYQLGIALVQTVNNGIAFDQHFGSYLDIWFKVFEKESEINKNVTKYIVNNQQEKDFVFSKLLEAFFEKPYKLKTDLPNTFAHLCLLLNQNILNISNDYKFEKLFFKTENLLIPLPKKVIKTYQYNVSHWTYKLPFLSIISIFFFYLHLFPKIVINLLEIITFITIIGTINALLSYNYISRKQIYQNKFEYWIVSVLGITPTPFLLVVLLSYFINFNPKITYHNIDKVVVNDVIKSNNSFIESFTFYLTDNFLANYKQARTIEINQFIDYQNIGNSKQLKLTIAKGITGFDIITEKQIIIDEHSRY